MSAHVNDEIPVQCHHRGIGVHAWQSPERVEIVKAAIDEVFGLPSIPTLLGFLKDARNAPEARLFAAARLRAMHELAAESRIGRPAGVDLAWLDAYTAGMTSRTWMHARKFTTLLDPDCRDAVDRETPLTDEDRRPTRA